MNTKGAKWSNWFSLFLILVFCNPTCSADDHKNIVLQWNDVILSAIRTSGLGPPVVARALAIAHTCMFDAWAAYDDDATATQLGGLLRRPQAEQTIANKETAISYAAYRAGVDLFPKAKASILDHFMAEALGLDPTNADVDPESPIGIGNASCNAVLKFRHADGSNQLGDLDASGKPYADYTGYSAVNPRSGVPVKPATVENPNRFQPLYYDDPYLRSAFGQQAFLGAQWYKVIPFAGPYTDILSGVFSAFPMAQYGTKQYEQQAKELMEISATLTDEQKMISEYWTDGPHSELPAGHWCLHAQFVSIRDHHSLDDDVKMFFALTNAAFDAGIVAWDAKRQFDSVRPVTAIPYLFKGKMIKSWGGPGKGTVSEDGAQWIPYQPSYFPSPPFPEYPSGHSAFSAAAATILRLWTGSDTFGASVTFAAGSSRVERGVTPKSEVLVRWPTFTSAADQAGMSRRYGGLHFESGDLAGRALGRLVGECVWKSANVYFGRSEQRQPPKPSVLPSPRGAR